MPYPSVATSDASTDQGEIWGASGGIEENRPGLGRPGQARPGHARPGQPRPAQAKPGPGQVRPGERMVDEHVPKERFAAQAICREFHVFWHLTPPYCGKWMSGVELLWSEVKRRYRASFRCERNTLGECMELLHEIMAEVSGKPELLLCMFLPGWRCRLAILNHTEKTMDGKRRIPLPE